MMRVVLHNELTGRLEELRTKAPAVCRIGWPSQAREPGALLGRFFSSFLAGSLAYLGYQPAAADGGADLSCGGPRPEKGIWLQPAGWSGRVPSFEECRDRGFEEGDLRLLCLKTHYRGALEFSWESLAAARAERGELLAAAQQLAAARVAPNATGLAGYKKRFRDALAADLDSPEALATLWDALRPGALSPGSRLAALQDAEQVFDLLRVG